MFEKQIEKGVAWLDKTYGRDIWLRAIDTDRLDLANSRTCMIGQLEGDYNDFTTQGSVPNFLAVLVGKKSNGWAAKRGFYLPGVHSPLLFLSPMVRLKYEILTDEWKKKIAELRRTPATPPAPKAVLSPVQRKDLVHHDA